jgi:arsenite methyltransferase
MQRPNYGIDALPVVRNMGLVGLAALVLFILSFVIHSLSGLRYMFLGFFVSFSVTALLMILYAKVGKFGHRERMLNFVDWRGDEHVLDVGTGRGVLLIGAAKRLTFGRAVGIDIWNEEDLSGNKKENTLKNAELEDVASKVEVKDDDARKMSFADETFDVVLSNLCLHNIPDKEGRRQACREIARVLKPNGTAVLSDFKSNKLYASEFNELGLKTTISLASVLTTFPPLRILIVTK